MEGVVLSIYCFIFRVGLDYLEAFLQANKQEGEHGIVDDGFRVFLLRGHSYFFDFLVQKMSVSDLFLLDSNRWEFCWI